MILAALRKGRVILLLCGGISLCSILFGKLFYRLPICISIIGDTNLGWVPQNSNVERTFLLQNRSTHAVFVRSILTSCHCTRVSLQGGAEIAANQEVPMRVQFDTSNASGRLATDLIIKTDSDANPYIITLHAMVFKLLETNADNLGRFDVSKGQLIKKTVSLKWLNAGKFDVLSARSLMGYVDVYLKVLQPQTAYEMSIVPRTDKIIENWRDIIVVETSCPNLPEWHVALEGSVSSTISVDPKLEEIALDTTKSLPKECEFNGVVSGAGAFRIRNIAIDGDAPMSYVVTKISDNRWAIHVTLNPKFIAAEASSTKCVVKRVISIEPDGNQGILKWPIFAVVSH